MKLFTKAPIEPQVKGTISSFSGKSDHFPKTRTKQLIRSPKSSHGPIIDNTREKSSSANEDPYCLTRVPTAQGYESDDSDEELGRVPSRYDTKTVLPDDIAYDDQSTDRYSQIGRPLALLGSDSGSAQWRSFEEFDERDPRSDVFDPLLFDRDNNDWDDLDASTECDQSLVGNRDQARHMRSLTDVALGEEADEESPVSHEIPSFINVLDSDHDDLSRKQFEEEIRDSMVPVVVHSPSNDELTNHPSQDEENNVQGVAHELGTSEQGVASSQGSSMLRTIKGFGLFRRKAQNISRARIPPTRRQQRRRALEDKSEQQSQGNYDITRETHVTSPPRGILKASSFVSRPETEEEIVDGQNHVSSMKADTAGFLGLLSSFFTETNGEPAKAGSPEGHVEKSNEGQLGQDASFLDSICGLPKAAVGKNSSNEKALRDHDLPASLDQKTREDALAESNAAVENRNEENKGLKLDQNETALRPHDCDFRRTSGNDTTPQDGNTTSKNRSTTVLAKTKEEYAGNDEIVVVQCLRNNNCEDAAAGLAFTINQVNTFPCGQTFEFMDDIVLAKHSNGNEVNKALSLEDKTETMQRSKRRQTSDGYDEFHDPPIKTIEFARLSYDHESASEGSLASYGLRRKTGLSIDTKLEQEMRQMQDELTGKKKKSLFGRMKRASEAKNKRVVKKN